MATPNPDPAQLPARDPGITVATHWCPIPYYANMRPCVVRDGDLAKTKDGICITCKRDGMVQNDIASSSEPARDPAPHFRGVLADGAGDDESVWDKYRARADAVAADQQAAPRMATGYCKWCALDSDVDEKGFHHIRKAVGTKVTDTLIACTGVHAPKQAQPAEAGDEVARLTAELAQARREAERLREALSQIYGFRENNMPRQFVIDRMREIARAALEAK